MTRAAAYALVAALGVGAALALVSCGGSDAKLLPGNTAQEIGENVDSVQQLVDENECVDAQDAALEVSSEVEALSGIDPKLKEALEKAAARLNEVVSTCEEEEEDTVETTLPDTTESTEEEPDKKEKKQKKEPEVTLPEEEKEAKPPAEPPEPPGKAKGHEEEAPPAEEPTEGGPSGGIGPGSEAGEGG